MLELVSVQDHDDEGNGSLKINIKNKDTEINLTFYDGEPEDNSLGRNFSDCYRIVEALQLAYEAGKRGDSIQITDIDNSDMEDEDEDEDDEE